ncbi:hypothetical protein EE612_008815 [Oryza sativa]|nr:hypothetical protein EE612_008815 [Oryza sativa]
MTNLLISSPTHTAKNPFGTDAPPPLLFLPGFGASAALFHLLRSWCSLTMSLILLLLSLPPCSPIVSAFVFIRLLGAENNVGGD